MDIGSIFLILALLIPVVIYVGRPLMERRASSINSEEQLLSTLLAQRDQVVATIQELDDDYYLGKIPSDNYPAQRQSLLENGANILRQIDAHQLTPATVAAEERLEAAILAHHLTQEGGTTAVRKNGNGVPPVPDDELEQKIASRRRARVGKAGGFCPRCGRPVQVIDHFCPKCGANLA